MTTMLTAWCFVCAKYVAMRPPCPRLQIRGGVTLRTGDCALCGASVFRVGGARGSHDPDAPWLDAALAEQKRSTK